MELLIQPHQARLSSSSVTACYFWHAWIYCSCLLMAHSKSRLVVTTLGVPFIFNYWSFYWISGYLMHYFFTYSVPTVWRMHASSSKRFSPHVWSRNLASVDIPQESNSHLINYVWPVIPIATQRQCSVMTSPCLCLCNVPPFKACRYAFI